MQTATFCGQQGRISRTVRAILNGQPGISAGQRGFALLISIDCCSRKKLCFLNQYSKSCSQSASDPVKLAVSRYLSLEIFCIGHLLLFPAENWTSLVFPATLNFTSLVSYSLIASGFTFLIRIKTHTFRNKFL